MIGSAKALILSSGQPLKTIKWLSLSLCLVGCVTNANSPNEQAKIWNDTIIDINGHPPRPVSDIASFAPVPQEKMPAVVYLHGCGGRGNSAHSHIRFFKLMGFAVFAPNHHSRSNAVTQCDPDKAKPIGRWGRNATGFTMR